MHLCGDTDIKAARLHFK